MKARGLLLALWAASAAMRADGQSPDWFDAFRGRAYLQGDASYVVREKTAPADAPPLFRARWVVLRYAGLAERERRWWPYRNILLVAMPSGARYVIESSLGFRDEGHLDEERPWERIASARAAFEVWTSGSPAAASPESGPCDGMRQRVVAPGGSLAFFLEDLGSRTVRASLEEISAATFDEDERRDLAVLLRTSVDSNITLSTELPVLHLRDPVLAVNVALRDQVPAPDKRTLVFVPESQIAQTAQPAHGDLSSWRALAHLPLDLPPFPALPPEGGLK